MKEVKGKKLWKTYFWFSMILTLLILIGLIFVDIDIFVEDNIFSYIYDFIFLIISIFSFIGLYGFIYENKYFNKELWIFVFLILAIEGISEIITYFNNYQFLFILVAYITLIPFYYALYQYSFKMDYIWSEKND